MITSDGQVLPTVIALDQDFAWLDDLIELYDAFFTDGSKKAFVAAIQAHFTKQEADIILRVTKEDAIAFQKTNFRMVKQHQADLLRARIGELDFLQGDLITYRDLKNTPDAALDNRREQLQTELANLEGEKDGE